MAHSCRSLSRFLWHEAARSIFTAPGRDGSPSQVTPPQFFWFSWVERGTVRVTCLAQEHNTVSPARCLRTDHEATAPPVEIRAIYYRVVWETLCGCLIIENLQVWELYPHSILWYSSLTSVSLYNTGLKIVWSYQYCWVSDVVLKTIFFFSLRSMLYR